MPSRDLYIPHIPAFGEIETHEGGKLPHWFAQQAVYFVTFRLHDSLPAERLRKWKRDLELLAPDSVEDSDLSRTEFRHRQRLLSEQVDGYLDRGDGECYLEVPSIAQIVADSLQYFEDERYRLFSWVIMPNHVHVVLRTLDQNELPEIIRSWKSYTAQQANDELGREGRFWQPDYFDRILRNEDDYEETVEYILSNPENAGLKKWDWVWYRSED